MLDRLERLVDVGEATLRIQGQNALLEKRKLELEVMRLEAAANAPP
jgi:hypothetical protein